MSENEVLLDARGLMKSYRGRRVVNNVNITVSRGEEKGLTVDGKPLSGNLVPLTDAAECRVSITV